MRVDGQARSASTHTDIAVVGRFLTEWNLEQEGAKPAEWRAKLELCELCELLFKTKLCPENTV